MIQSVPTFLRSPLTLHERELIRKAVLRGKLRVTRIDAEGWRAKAATYQPGPEEHHLAVAAYRRACRELADGLEADFQPGEHI